jgi:Glycosyltransferase family 87
VDASPPLAEVLGVTWPWYAFCLIFVLPFFDPRRPFRLLHVDLVVLAGAGIGPLHAWFGIRPPGWSIVITAAGLLWLLGRLLWVGFRAERRPEPLVPLLPTRWLAVAVVVLVCVRIASVPVHPAYVSDVGLASLIGADLIGEGHGIYDGQVHRKLPHGDTYGPVAYLAYVPLEQAIPWSASLRLSDFEQPKAGYAAGPTFDLLILLGLFFLGRVLRRGSEGARLGVALAWAWAASPYALLTLRYSTNDAVAGLLCLWAVVALHHPLARGGLGALAAATKFAPLVLAPLLATGTGERRLRASLLFAAAFVAVTLAVYLPLMPDGGIAELYDRTLGFQEERRGWVLFWGSFPELNWLQTVTQVAVAALAVAVAFVPRRKTPLQVVALAGALLIAVQLTGRNWWAPYAVWFLPLAFAGLLAPYDCTDVTRPHLRRRARGAAATS